MAARTQDAILLIVLAVVEVILTEAAIRSGITGVERASGILFILIALNFALVMAISRRRKPGGR